MRCYTDSELDETIPSVKLMVITDHQAPLWPDVLIFEF